VRAVNGSGQTLANDGQWWYFVTANSAAFGAPASFGQEHAGQRDERAKTRRPTASS
jgi:hypothetical protein